jgi:rod shape-determining protein MreD
MFPVILLVVVMLNQVYAPFIRLPGGLAPDLALLVAVCAGLTYAPVGAAWLGFTAGLIQESLTGGLLGVGALSKGLIGLVWTPLWRQKVSDAPLLQLPLLVGLTILDGAIFFCTCRLFSSPVSSWDTFFPLLWRQLLSNILLGPFLLILFGAIHRRLMRTKRSSRRRHASAITFQPE